MAAYSLTFDHGITADTVASFSISQSEGDFATLEIVVKNPGVGLLSGDLWATFARDGTTLFYGRLVGVPEDMQDESVRLVFLARPDTYEADKVALAETLKVDPFYDPVWVAPDDRLNPDSILEARPALWHIDRVTHNVTISDIISGEAGTVTVNPLLVDRTSLKMTYGETPAEKITCKAEIHWRQKAQGQIPLTGRLMEAFDAAASTSGSYIITMTGEGLVSNWPKTGQSIGGGWKVGDTTVARNEELTSVLPVRCSTGGFKGEAPDVWTGTWPFPLIIPDVVMEDSGDNYGNGTLDGDKMVLELFYRMIGPSFTRPNYYDDGPIDTGGPSVVGFPTWYVVGTLNVEFDADRERVETIEFTINADVQPLVSAREDANLTVELSSSEVDQPIDPGGLMPIGDIRRNSYLNTDRGKRSLAYLIALCRARLLARARAVQVSFTTTMDVGQALTLRHSVSLSDPRLPGGIATGKVVGLTLSLDPSDGQAKAEVTVACTIGRGNALTVSTPGPTYADPSYYASGYAAVTGGATQIASDIAYTPIDTTPITESDLDLFALTEATAVESLTVTGGHGDQAIALLTGMPWHDSNAAKEALDALPTHVELILTPVTGDPIVTPYPVEVSDLMVPKTIDLE